MRVAIFGGTGFVGRYLVEDLERRGADVVLLVRPNEARRSSSLGNATIVEGDIGDESAVHKTVEGCDAVIYCVAILRELKRAGVTFEALQWRGVERVVSAAKNADIQQLILFSANGVRERGTPYFETKFKAEEAIKNSGIRYTILRPSLIFGDPRGAMEIATQLHRDMVRPPLPAVGFHAGWSRRRGQFQMSAVAIQDVSEAVSKVVFDGAWSNQTIALGGPEDLTWTQLIRRVANAVGKSKWIVPMPIPIMYFAATMFDWLSLFPVTRDQLTMLAEGNVASPEPLAKLLQRPLRRFDEASLTYLRGDETD